MPKENALRSGAATAFQRDPFIEQWGSIPRDGVTCLWDVDDQDRAIEGGYLDAGASVVITGCFIADPVPILGRSWAVRPNFHVLVTSPTPLDVRFALDPSGWDATLASSGSYRYEVGTSGPVYAATAPVVVPVGEHGGAGVPSSYTLTITNPSARRIRGIGVSLTGGNDQDPLPGVEPIRRDGWTLWVKGS